MAQEAVDPAAILEIDSWSCLIQEDETLLLVSYQGEETSVNVPESLNDKGRTRFVSAIGAGAFQDHPTLTEVICPDTLQTIGMNAFMNCSQLTAVRLPANLLRIERFVFAQCSALREITFPEQLTYIGVSAFADCISLESVVFPETVKSIRDDAFNGCSSLKNVEFNGVVDSIDSRVFSGTPFLSTLKGDFIILGNNVLVLYKGNDKHVTVPAEVRTISGAFEGCTFIESIELPPDLVYIGTYAFSGCTGLEEIVLPFGVQNIEAYAFTGCTNLRSVSLPDSLQTVGDNAFRNCHALERILLPDNITNINSEVFNNCDRLTSIRLPKNLETIGSLVFIDCIALRHITMSQYVEVVPPDLLGGTIDVVMEVVFGSAGEAFAIENEVPFTYLRQSNAEYEYIRDEQGILLLYYSGTNPLVTIPDSIDDVNVYGVGVAAFQAMEQIQSVSMPSNISLIEDWAFSWCTGLKEFTLSDNLTSIGGDAFRGCEQLKSIFLPDSIQILGDDVFALCDSTAILADKDSAVYGLLEKQGIPVLDAFLEGTSWSFEKVGDTIWVQKFIGAEEEATLLSAYFGKRVAGIRKGAFEGASVKMVTLPALETIETGAFTDMQYAADIYIPEDCALIEPTAFDSNVVLHAYPQTAVEAYARQYGNKFLIIRYQ